MILLLVQSVKPLNRMTAIIMKNTIWLFLVILTVMVLHVKAEIFICIEHGVQVMKNSDNCSGKIKGVYSGDNVYQSYNEYLVTKANRDAAAIKVKNTKVVEPTLEELKSRCSQDFDDIMNFNSHSKRINRLLGVLTKNKCATTSVGCFQDFDNFINRLKNGDGTHSVSGDQLMASTLRAKCGLPQEPFNPDDQVKVPIHLNCTPNGIGRGADCTEQ